MAGITYAIDPVSEDAANTALTLVDNVTQTLIGEDLPAPPELPVWASSADTEGGALVSARHDNRQVTLSIRLFGSSAANLDTKILAISKKIEKLRREGGTLQRTVPSGATYVLDVLAGTTQPVWGQRGYVSNWRIDVTLQLTCKPYWRGTAVTLSDHVETTLPCLVFTETGIKGDVPALGKLVIDNDDASNHQAFLMWGLQSRYYSSAATASLFYEAEALTPLGSAAANAGPASASGATANKTVLHSSLTTSYQGVVSTQATGGGAHLSHIGDYRVWARVQCPTANTGTVKLALEWGSGDYRRYTQNSDWTMNSDWEGTWRLADLGLVHLPQVFQGTQRWEGRVLAKSTVAGDDVYVDCLFLMPVTEGYGEARSIPRGSAITTVHARDEFDQAAGNLSAKTAAVGGAWTTAGDATDFAVETTGKTIQRSVMSDATSGRYATLSSGLAAVDASVDLNVTVTTNSAHNGEGLLLRYVSTSNHAKVYVAAPLSGSAATTARVVIDISGTIIASADTPFSPNSWYTLRATIDTTGVITAWLVPRGAQFGVPVVVAQSATVAATGAVGIYDFNTAGGTAVTRNYDNFIVGPYTPDAAVFLGQSLEVRHNTVIREDSAGTLWAEASRYEGDYLLLPPAGAESRTARFIAKTSRNDPDTGADGGIDDISARLTYTPRFLHVPE